MSQYICPICQNEYETTEQTKACLKNCELDLRESVTQEPDGILRYANGERVKSTGLFYNGENND